MKLPGDVLVFPAHGAGSACGKNLSTETVSTIGEQRRTNYALAPMTEDQFVDAVTHPLRPYGGAACVSLPPEKRELLVKEVTARRLTGIAARTAGEFVLIARVGPLPGAADWTHTEADAANTGASEERFVKAPLDLLWFDTPPRWFRTPGATLVRVCGGRMFIKDEKLQAVDVFTGRRLWQAVLPFHHSVNDQIVALDETLYVAGGKTCLKLDPASGQELGRIELPSDLTGPWLNLRVCGSQLVGQSGKVEGATALFQELEKTYKLTESELIPLRDKSD